jgi:hypothetical protein
MAKDLSGDSLVVNPLTGETESNLSSLMAAGLIREHNGQWELAGPDGQFHAAAGQPAVPAQDQAQGEQQASQRDDTEQPADAREFLAHEDEAALRDLEAHIGEDLFASMERFIVEDQEPPEHLMASIAQRYDGDRDAALQALATVAAPLVQQATAVVEQAVGPGSAQEVFDYARSSERGRELLKSAMRDQVDNRSTKGYTALSVEFLRHLADRDPARVVAGLREGGSEAKVVNGKVLVNLGKAGGGWTEFTSALRGNVVKAGGR